MKTATHKTLLALALFGLIGSLSGCASNCQSWNPFKDRPIRTKISSWFQGAPCSTCNAPAGQPLHFGTNTAPACATCGTDPTPVGGIVNGFSLYGDPALNGPATTPAYEQGIQSPGPAYSETSETVNPLGTGVLAPDF
ncbi:MAG: hypothetical protein ACI87E_005076 [Mariniblastus sp.]|jgi:hypothetical protein